jgi:hypothetical protein
VPEDGGTEETSELFCLVTSLLDPERYPALDLACCYPDRWGCETVIGHHKTGMGEGQPVLRSKDPPEPSRIRKAIRMARQNSPQRDEPPRVLFD